MLIERPRTIYSGNTAEEIQQLQRYLFRLSEQLELALNSVDSNIKSAEKAQTETDKVIKDLSSQGSHTGDTDYNELRSLIQKTAEIVEGEIEILEEELHSEYVAQSEFGRYQETTDQRIEANAAGVTNYYNFMSEISPKVDSLEESVGNITGDIVDVAGSVDEVTNNFNKYLVQTEAFIRSGLLFFDKDGTPVYGIAIGQDLQTDEEVIGENGEVYHTIKQEKQYTVYRANRLPFYNNDVEVAWFGNNLLHVNELEVLGSIKHGNWKITTTPSGWSLEWDG